MSLQQSRRLYKVLFIVSCFLLLIVLLFPFYWLLNNALKTGRELTAVPITYWPKELTLENFKKVFEVAPFWSYFKNSLIVSTVTVFITIVICTPAAYAISRYKSKMTLAVALTFLVFSMFPNTAFVIPIYKTLKTLNLLNSNIGLIITYLTFTIPSTIWLLYIYFNTVPRDLEEAALVDGATRLHALFRIILPLSAPGLASAAILSFVRCWNEFFYAFVLLTDKVNKTIPVGINDYKQEYRLNWELMAAASIVAVIPVVIVIVLFQKRIESGLVSGAVKS